MKQHFTLSRKIKNTTEDLISFYSFNWLLNYLGLNQKKIITDSIKQQKFVIFRIDKPEQQMLSERKRFSYLQVGQSSQQTVRIQQNYRGQSITSSRRYSRPRTNQPLVTALRQFNADQNNKSNFEEQKQAKEKSQKARIEYKYQDSNKKVNRITALQQKDQNQNKTLTNIQSGKKKLLLLSKDKQPKTIKDYQQQIQYLTNLNKKIVSDTTEQFQKFEKDIQQVDLILKDKEAAISQLKGQIQLKQVQASHVKQELYQKNKMIEEFQEKIKYLVQDTEEKDIIIENCLNEKSRAAQERKQSQILDQVQTHEQEVQTQESFLTEFVENQIKKSSIQQKENMYKSRCEQITQKAKQMQQEVYKLKLELYNANTELSLLKQEFSSYKILKEIQSIQMK